MNSMDSELGTANSPKYSIFSRSMAVSLGTGAILFTATVLAMFAFADTIVGELTLAMYSFLPILGVAIIGIGLYLGRYLGMSGFIDGNMSTAALGAGITVLTYGAFGGAVLTPYDPNLYIPATLAAAGITTLISLVAGTYVYSTNKSFEHWAKYSGGAFLVGIGAILFGSFIPGAAGGLFLLVGFVAFMIGFLFDLVYEIWHMSSNSRTPLANGFGLYIAFTGIFVHILQLVLRAYAES